MITFLKWSLFLTISSSLLNAQKTIQERAQHSKKVEYYYNLADRSYKNGDIDAARKALKSALSLNGRHANSIALAHRMRTGGNKTILAKRKRLFRQIMIPVFDLDGVSLSEAIKVLAMNVETQSKGKMIPNFVIQDKNKILKDTKITIKLKEVPAGYVLDQLMSSARASANFGKYTTVIRPSNR